MTVVAHCQDCGDEHSVGDRPAVGGQGTVTTTECPSCGDTSYRSESTSGPIDKTEAERITDAIEDVRGVGGQTLENITEAYSTFAELEGASVDELVEIENVGKQTAEGIAETVGGS